jgi:hypothetical protein
MHTKFCLESLKGRHHLENLSIDGRVILKWDGEVWTGFAGSE